jgi:hypothetical protein
MPFPTIPAGLPTSTEVLTEFSAFCAACPFASGSRGNVGLRRVAAGREPLAVTSYFGAFLRLRRPEIDAAAYLRRAEFPL